MKKKHVHLSRLCYWIDSQRAGIAKRITAYFSTHYSHHQPCDCLLSRLIRRRWKKTPKLRFTSLCVGNSPVTCEFPAQMVSNAEYVSIWWRHHEWWWHALKVFSALMAHCEEGNTPVFGKVPSLKENNVDFRVSLPLARTNCWVITPVPGELRFQEVHCNEL